ncbi:MAG: phosphotransferase [Patescibacteria group bacterium]
MTKANFQSSCKLIKDKLGFTGEKIYVADNKRGRLIAAGNWRGDKAVLKIVSLKQPRILERFEREAESDQLVRERWSGADRDLILPTRVLSWGVDLGCVWMVRLFGEGKTLSIDRRKKEDALFDKDVIRKEFLNSPRLLIPKIGRVLRSFQKIEVNSRERTLWNKKYPLRYPRKLDKSIKEELGQLIGFDLSPHYQFYQNIEEHLFQDNQVGAFMGDFVPPNIIVKSNKDISLFDFEWFGFDNKMMDIVSFWLTLWRYPSWQRVFLHYYDFNRNEKDNFRAGVIRQILLSGWVPRLVAGRQKHQWTKYLKLSGESFEALVGTNNS